MSKTVYCGVDFHARQQTIAFCNSDDGEIHLIQLDHHQDDLRKFYSQFDSQVIVALEASGYSPWFEQFLEDLGHTILLGHATDIGRLANRRQKNDRRDAELILDLLMRGQFPAISRHTLVSNEILRQLRFRNRLVKMRSMAKNYLQALAISSGLSTRSQLLSKAGRLKLDQARKTEVMALQVEEWLKMVDLLNTRIREVEKWLEKKAEGDKRVALLRTHPGIGPLTSLGLVHTLDPVTRFSNQRKVVAYLGMEPMERSSADKKRWAGISKAGSRLLRFLLIEAAQTAVKKDPQLKRFYHRLSRKKGFAKAMTAVGRKLLIRGWIMLRDEIDYQEFLRRGVEAVPAREAHKQEDA
jgi:transposase